MVIIWTMSDGYNTNMLMVKLTKKTHHFNKTTNVVCKTVAGSTSGGHYGSSRAVWWRGTRTVEHECLCPVDFGSKSESCTTQKSQVTSHASNVITPTIDRISVCYWMHVGGSFLALL